MIKKNLLLLFLVVTISACVTTQSSTGSRYMFGRSDNTRNSIDPTMPMEPGKCYAKCLMADHYEEVTDTLGIYTLDEIIPSEILTEKEVKPSSIEWTKKQVLENCESSNPDDCYVWCLVEVPAEYESPSIHVDSTQRQQLVIIDIRKLIKQGGYTEWKQVLCEKDINTNLIDEVCDSLQNRGFEINGAKTKGPKYKTALINFQKANNLPVGQLDIETLKALDINL